MEFSEVWRARCRTCGNDAQVVEVTGGALAGPQHCGQCGRNMQATAWGCDLCEFIKLSVPASDAAIALADEHAIDLRTVTGTGQEGFIRVADVRAAIKEVESAIPD